MNDSERRVASSLDSLGIAWEYEPVEIVLVADEAGCTKVGFRPDFWLPDYGLWIEVTVARGSTITRKRGKVRLANEQGHVVHLLTRRDQPHLEERITAILGA